MHQRPAKSASRVLTRRGLLMEDPEDTVDRPQVRALGAAVVKHRELLAEGEDLELERHSAPDGRDNSI